MQVFGFGGLGFLGSEILTKTLKHAKVGLAKVGNHSETLKLAKVGLATVSQAHNWSKSVKELAKVGLAKAEPDHDEFVEPNQHRVGWQSKAAREVESRSFEDVMDLFHDPQKALLRPHLHCNASRPHVSH